MQMFVPSASCLHCSFKISSLWCDRKLLMETLFQVKFNPTLRCIFLKQPPNLLTLSGRKKWKYYCRQGASLQREKSRKTSELSSKEAPFPSPPLTPSVPPSIYLFHIRSLREFPRFVDVNDRRRTRGKGNAI